MEPTMLRDVAESPQAGLLGSFPHTTKLLIRDSAVDIRIANTTTTRIGGRVVCCCCIVTAAAAPSFLLADMRIWMILLHDMNIQILGDILSQPPHDLPSFILLARHDEMTEENALLGDPIGGETQVAHLPMHLLDALPGCLGVVVGLEQPLRGAALPDLEVRQVDVHQAVHQFQRRQRIEGRSVVDDGEFETHVSRGEDGERDLRHDMLGSDEVDVVHVPDLLQLDIPLGQLLGSQVESISLVGDILS